jgi:acetylornithine/LysW-gamma-L-lysine aminotransferase
MIETIRPVEGLIASGINDLESQLSSGVYAKRDLVIARGQGALLFDEDGRQYIDCVGGQGVSNLGHAHPAVAAAIAAQAQTLISCPEMFYNRQRALFMERLVGLTGLQRVFLCNSGTEAVEAALKFARASTGRSQVIAAMRAFHGRTFGALSATWNKKYRQGVEPLVPGFTHVPYNNLDNLIEAINDETAAVILEVVQGEGGVYPGDAGFLQGAQALCQQRGALLILDEVQTGFGRTGRMFAYQHYGLQPDLLCVAKSIAGGIPMGAVMIGERLGKLTTGLHGSTFGGNPLACAAGLASLEAIESEGLVERAAEMGAYLMACLAGIDSPLVREVRGLGLMVGIEIKQKVAPHLQSLMEKGVLALPAGMTVIRLLPPLVITQSQIDRVVIALQEVLAV